MAAISYYIDVDPVLEKVTAGTNAPSAGRVELRIDTTATAVTDGNTSGGTRALKRGEIQAIMRVLEQYLLRDTNIPQ
jgi:hypothetical protein